MGKQFVCGNCGKTIYRRDSGHHYKYCSQSCYHDARFGKIIDSEIVSARNPLCLEAMKLCQSGLNKKESAEQVGIKEYVFWDWYSKYGIKQEETIFSGRICEYCGKSLLGMKALSRRKYCSKRCSGNAAYWRKHPHPGRMKYDFDFCEKAMELYWGGLEGRAIARYLGIAEGTMYSWIHYFGHFRKRRQDPELMKLLPIDLRVESARKSAEWKKLLRENAPAGDTAPVIIVCGSRNGHGGINGLVTTVLDRLKRNPCDGATYAFCSSSGAQISTICWLRESFCLTKLPKANGGYIWPASSVGLQIELRKNEFEYLLSLSKKRGAKPYFT